MKLSSSFILKLKLIQSRITLLNFSEIREVTEIFFTELKKKSDWGEDR